MEPETWLLFGKEIKNDQENRVCYFNRAGARCPGQCRIPYRRRMGQHSKGGKAHHRAEILGRSGRIVRD